MKFLNNAAAQESTKYTGARPFQEVQTSSKIVIFLPQNTFSENIPKE